ncbi:MAG: SUMF1/EgtB/PvdO family nonheme iron enzyme [Prevotellaceae bacterium]|nr:SUMF1/EgtB/PvdO family nonheme iron enzyme [Prevotellaceae bacterium]
MNKSLYLTVVIILSLCLYGCMGSNYGYTGELSRGTKGKSAGTTEIPPSGMIYIPSGHVVIGNNDQDILWAMNAVPRTITINAFWMDQTEITNYEYRQFANYVRDSIIRALLGTADDNFFLPEDEDFDYTDDEKRPLNWRARINRKDEAHRSLLREMNYSGDEAISRREEIDVRKLIYEYSWIDYQQAAHARYDAEQKKYTGFIINAQGEREEIRDRSSFIMKESVYVYPDTLCWIRDFAFSYNEPFVTSYFSHVSYNDYPVVGISWKQATAFCWWRTDMIYSSLSRDYPNPYRLPNEAEWEYAARGGLESELYPWGGPYATNKEGCYLANFKPQRGKYELDGGVYTMPVGSYEPNDYGLYDMAGNVSEWTSNTFDENAYSQYHDLEPNFTTNSKSSDPSVFKRKVVRGGSWKDISYFLQCGTRMYEYQDSTKSYIGFRCVRSYMGTR